MHEGLLGGGNGEFGEHQLSDDVWHGARAWRLEAGRREDNGWQEEPDLSGVLWDDMRQSVQGR